MMRNLIHRIWRPLISALVLLLVGGCGGGGGDSGTAGGISPVSLFAVRGTTTGLIGEGLTLQNNGTGDLSIIANGAFKFLDRVQDNTPCNVTVLSQPTNPQQVCEVINGSQMIGGNDIDDIQVVCVGAFQDTFDTKIDIANWVLSGGYSRALLNGALEYRLSATGGFNSDYTDFADVTCGSVSMDVTIAEAISSANGTAVPGVRLESCGYHSTAIGEGPGDKTGDVFASIVLKGAQSPFQAYYYVYKCLNNLCNSRDNIEFLTPEDMNANWLGEVALNQPATLMIDWDGINQGQFSFQIAGGPITSFDPVAAGASFDAVAPNSPEKLFGVNIGIDDPDSSASMTAFFDNAMINGITYDDFNLGTYPNASLWNKTYGRLGLDNGSLLIASGKEYSGDAAVDAKKQTTGIDSHDDLIPNREIVSCDIAMDSGTAIIDTGGNPAGGDAMIEMRFNPFGANSNNDDLTNVFSFHAGLAQDATGLVAQVRAIGCMDSTCATKYLNDTMTFTTLVANDIFYHFTIEHVGNGNIEISINDSETLNFDLSAIPEFIASQFRQISLRTTSKGTDEPGEQALIRARFDNVDVGEPF